MRSLEICDPPRIVGGIVNFPYILYIGRNLTKLAPNERHFPHFTRLAKSLRKNKREKSHFLGVFLKKF